MSTSSESQCTDQNPDWFRVQSEDTRKAEACLFCV